MFNDQNNYSPKRNFLNQGTIQIVDSQQEDSLNSLKDSLISLQFRIKTMQSQINSKMERQECLTLMQRKANNSYVKKGFQQVYAKFETDRIKQETNFQKMQQQQKQKINELKKKLKQINSNRQVVQFGNSISKDNPSFQQCILKKVNKVGVKSQQLYLQSNQTMFSILIDQIKQLKQKNPLLERLIQSKHKKNISLNNQVCKKLEHFETQLEEIVKHIDKLQYKPVVTNSSQLSEGKKSNKKIISKNQRQQLIELDKNLNQNQAFEMMRLELLAKSIEIIQKQVSQKLNIKDVIPLIKQNMPTFQESIQEMKNYVEQNFESMRKILQHQSQINEQISKSNRVGWWHCYEKVEFEQSEQQLNTQKINYILFSKEIMNIVPENLIVEKSQEQTLKILTKGWYLIHIYELQPGNQQSESEEQVHVWIEVNNGSRHPVIHNRLLNLTAGSQLRILTSREDLFVQVQKL